MTEDKNEQLKERIARFLRPVVEDYGAELVDVELRGSPNNQLLRLLVDKQTGISIRDCQAISTEVADLLDVEDPFPGRFRLEVTSPGLDRPLLNSIDFARAQGRLVTVVLNTGQTYQGRLTSWSEEVVELHCGQGETERVKRQMISKARIEPEF